MRVLRFVFGGERRPLALLTVLLLSLCVAPIYAEAALFGGGSGAVTKGGKEDQIRFWRGELQELRAKEVSPALARMHAAQAALAEAKKREGFFYTKPEDKARIRMLDEDFSRALAEVETIRAREKMMLAKLKPLYGVLSRQFVQEQKESIASAVSTVQTMSYDNAWYSSLFSVGEAESITDIVVGFLVKWLVGYVVLYPFAVMYYSVFVAPWSVFQYMSSFSDVVPALVAYILSVTAMSLPLVALVGGFWYVFRMYEPRIRASMAQARQRQQYRRQYHRD